MKKSFNLYFGHYFFFLNAPTFILSDNTQEYKLKLSYRTNFIKVALTLVMLCVASIAFSQAPATNMISNQEIQGGINNNDGVSAKTVACPASAPLTASLVSTNATIANNSTVACNAPFYIKVTDGNITADPTTGLTPCWKVEFNPLANLASRGTATFYENSVLFATLCPTCTANIGSVGGGTTAATPVSWTANAANYSVPHHINLCNGNLATGPSTVTIKSCWANTVLAGPTVWNTATAGCFTIGIPANTAATGTADYSITPASGVPGLTDNYNGQCTIDPSVIPAGTTYTVTYKFNSPTCGIITGTYKFTTASAPTLTTNITNTTICQGSSVNLTVNGISSNVSFSNTADYAIPDNSATGVSSPVTVSGLSGTVGTNLVSVNLNITHTWDSDLSIYLVCPGGSSIALSTGNGGSGDNYTNTTFSTSGTAITSGSAPFTGTFTPQQAFSGLSACNMNGTWTLLVKDLSGISTGTLLDWTITFVNPNSYTWAPNTAITSTVGTSVVVNPTTTTVYTVTGTDPNGCSAGSAKTITVTVTSAPTITVTATNSVICNGESVTLTASGTASSYTWTGGVTNGVAFTPSSTVTYTATGIGAGCTNTAAQTVSVNFCSSVYCPAVNPVSASSSICQGNSTSLSAAVVPIAATTSYSVGAIPYNPFAYSGGTAVLVSTDDVWSSKFNLPFSFCFAGSTFTSAILGANGLLSFQVSDAGLYESYVIPSTGFPLNTAAASDDCVGVLRDINPADGGCTIAYYTTGTAPCRAFVTYYKTVEIFGSSCDPSDGFSASTFQIVLYENTNVIDIYIENSTNCAASTSSGYGVVGMQHYPAPQQVVTAPGRDGTTFTAVNEAWRFTPTGAANGYTVTWASPSNTNIGTGLGPIAVSPTISTTYTATMKVVTCAGSTVTYTNSTSIAVNACLPIELLNFTAIKQADDVLLKWSTATEINSSHFEVERSVDAYAFTKIGYNVPAAGNSNTQKNYTLLDPEPLSGINYYRLKEVDYDGTLQYSDIISVDFDNSLYDVSIVPQPVSQNAELIFKSTVKSSLNIDIYDLTGRKVIETFFEMETGRNVIKLDLSSISKGLYFLTISNDKETMQRIKLLKE